MHSISQWGPFVFTYVLFGGSEALENFKNLDKPYRFLKCFLLQNVLFDGTGGTGWTGWTVTKSVL